MAVVGGRPVLQASTAIDSKPRTPDSRKPDNGLPGNQ
jgi:hypothetical protein